jgi:hypothetical protein
MSGPRSATLSSLVVAVALGIVACTGFYEIPIETPIQPKMDVSGFQRVLVVGFISGGTEDVDANLETVRLLRSQLRTKSPLRVIEAEVVPLADIAAEELKDATASTNDSSPLPAVAPMGGGSTATGSTDVKPIDQTTQDPSKQADAKTGDAKKDEPRIRSEKDLQKYDKIFADTAYWKKLGEEYQNPLIVTGTVLFTPQTTSGPVVTQREIYDSFGRRSVVPVRTFQERKGFILQPRFVFIDGRTGTQLYAEGYREEILYPAQQVTPALSSYFELMDRVMPAFLSTLSAQKIRGTRVLLK